PGRGAGGWRLARIDLASARRSFQGATVMTIDTTTETKGDELDLIHAVTADIGTIFTWDYERSRVPLMKLYEKAKTSQWNASTDLDWSVDVDIEKVVLANMAQNTANGTSFFGNVDLSGTAFAKWTEKEWVQLAIEGNNWT